MYMDLDKISQHYFFFILFPYSYSFRKKTPFPMHASKLYLQFLPKEKKKKPVLTISPYCYRWGTQLFEPGLIDHDQPELS